MEPQLLGEIRLVMADDLSGYLKVTDGKLDLVLARLKYFTGDVEYHVRRS
jgi:hypothetical protein